MQIQTLKLETDCFRLNKRMHFKISYESDARERNFRNISNTKIKYRHFKGIFWGDEGDSIFHYLFYFSILSTQDILVTPK